MCLDDQKTYQLKCSVKGLNTCHLLTTIQFQCLQGKFYLVIRLCSGESLAIGALLQLVEASDLKSPKDTKTFFLQKITFKKFRHHKHFRIMTLEAVIDLSFSSVKSFPRVFLLLLVDHDADDDAGDACKKSKEKKEEQFDAGHGTRLGVLNVVSRRLEVARWRLDLWPIFRVGRLGLIEFVQLHGDDVVVVWEVAWKERMF